MMLAPSNKDTRSLRKEATHVASIAPKLPVVASPIEDFDPFARHHDDEAPKPKAKRKDSNKAEKKQSRSKQTNTSRSTSANRRKVSNTSNKDDFKASNNAKKSLKEPKSSSLDTKSEHIPRRGDMDKIKEKRRAASTRNLLDSNSKKDRTPSVKRGKTKSDSASATAVKKDKSRDPSRSKRNKITRTKTLPDNAAAWANVEDSTRPQLRRSNSLDSRLEDLDKAEKKNKRTTDKKSKRKTSLTHRKVTSNRNLSAKEAAKKKQQRKDPLSLDSTSEHKQSTTKTKRSIRINRAKSTVEESTDLGKTLNQGRPVLARSNSLDSKLDDLDGKDDRDTADTKKQDPQGFRPSLTEKRRSTLTVNRGPSKRSIATKDPLALKTERETLLKRERSRISRKSSLGEHLVGERKQETTAYPMPKGLVRSNSVGSGLDLEHEKAVDAAKSATSAENTIQKKPSFRRSTMAGKNHALKMFMQRTVEEETAAETLKTAQLEKLSDIKLKFQSIAKEQLKVTDAAISRKSALSVVPVGAFSHAAALALNTKTPTLGGAYKAFASGNKPELSRAGSVKADNGLETEGTVSVQDVANRMKELGTSFRVSKRQLSDNSQLSQRNLL